MKLKFLGDYAQLQKCVARTGVIGEWREIPNNQIQYRTDDGAILNWWESTGTVIFQGGELAIQKLKKPLVRTARRKGLLEGKRDTDEEIARLKRRMKFMRIDIAELKEAVAKS
jgi:hypothetical protein